MASTSKGKKLCAMLEKPSDADARALKTLFPSSSHLSKRSRTARIKFMQSAGCVANLSTHKVNRIMDNIFIIAKH